MKILFDGYIYRVQNPGGINRYLANIIDRLPHDWKPVITVRHVPELNFSKHPQLVLKRFPAPRLRPTRLAEWAAERYLSGVDSQSGYT